MISFQKKFHKKLSMSIEDLEKCFKNVFVPSIANFCFRNDSNRY